MPQTPPPVIVLVRPQMAENIGAAARAMVNFGACDLRLVNPRYYDETHAARMACDGRDILENIRIFDTLREALADCTYTIATSRRLRHVQIPPLTPQAVVTNALALPAAKIALVFGAEQSGLTNDELFLCDTASSIPTSEKGSLNLGQSVVIFLYEWFRLSQGPHFFSEPDNPLDRLASHEEKQRVYDLMHTLLVASDYKPLSRLPEFIRRVKYLFEYRPLSFREQKILLKVLRYFEKLVHG